MKNILLFCAVMLLAGCQTIPITQKFPDAPAILMDKCQSLETLDKPTVYLSELMTTVTNNYTKYHICANQVESWQDWYNKQKAIYDKINK
jgi:hypothetical protein